MKEARSQRLHSIYMITFIFHDGKCKTDKWLPGVGRGVEYERGSIGNFWGGGTICDTVLLDSWIYAFVKTYKTVQYKEWFFYYMPLKKVNQDSRGTQDEIQTMIHEYNVITNEWYDDTEGDEEERAGLNNFGNCSDWTP